MSNSAQASAPVVTAGRAPAATDATIVSLFNARVHSLRNRPALHTRDADGLWQSMSWADYGKTVRALARALSAEGVGEGSGVALMSTNRAENAIADLAVLASGAVAVPILESASTDQMRYVLEHSGASVVFVEGGDGLERIARVRGDVDTLRTVVAFDVAGSGGNRPDPDVTYTELVESGRSLDADDPAEYDNSCAEVQTDDVACLVYTSGTTAPPKAAMLSHHNITWTARSLSQMLPTDDYRVLAYLPTAHIAERIVNHYTMIYYGGETWFGSRLDSLGEDLRDARPTVFFGDPTVFERLETEMRGRLGEANGLSRLLAEKAQAVGERTVQAQQARGRTRLVDALAHRFLDRVFLSGARADVGLDAAEAIMSGAAPLSRSTAVFFHTLGLPVTEVYGQTETCGATTMNPVDRIKIGSVGPPIPGVDVKIADDGEVLVHGGNVFRGYFHDDAATTGALDGGWLHSGDVGSLDEDGYLTISGRTEDLVGPGGGQTIPPPKTEA